jgi:hypothetical protein
MTRHHPCSARLESDRRLQAACGHLFFQQADLRPLSIMSTLFVPALNKVTALVSAHRSGVRRHRNILHAGCRAVYRQFRRILSRRGDLQFEPRENRDAAVGSNLRLVSGSRFGIVLISRSSAAAQASEPSKAHEPRSTHTTIVLFPHATSAAPTKHSIECYIHRFNPV